MATRLYDAISQSGNHEIGQLNSKWTVHLPNGFIATENIENFTLAEVFYDEGVLKCRQLTDATKKGYLVTTVEEDQLLDGETYTDFYNAAGEPIRLTDVTEQKNSRFETSAFELNADGATNGGTTVTEITNGMVAHFNPATKKYMISNATSPATAYSTAINKFEVVDADSNFGYAFDKPTIRLRSI